MNGLRALSGIIFILASMQAPDCLGQALFVADAPHFLGFSERDQNQQREIQQAYARLRQDLWPNLRKVPELLRERNTPEQRRSLLQESKYRQLWADRLPGKEASSFRAVFPTLCRFGPHIGIFVEQFWLHEHGIQTSVQNKWLTSGHVGLTSSPSSKAETINQVATAIASLLRQLPPRPTQPHRYLSKLHYQSTSPTRAKLGADEQCLQLLLSQAIASEVYTNAGPAHLELQKIFDLSEPMPVSKKHNRLLSLTWQVPDPNWSLPLKLETKTRLIESVITAKDIPQGTQTLQMTLAQDNQGQILLRGVEPLLKILQAPSLDREIQPTVVAKRGAWAYLNVGRAWGLTMNTRMISEDQQIQGHVVAFYGPQKEAAPGTEDFLQEGAILYIRKGQSLVQAGTRFTFDPKQFPDSGQAEGTP
jgi:hypothetical protein